VDDASGSAPEPRPDRPPSANASGRQVFANIVSSYANLFIGILLSLVLTRVLLRHLGTSAYGLWIVLLAIVSYTGLLDAGVSTAAVQRIAQMSATGDVEGVGDIIRTAWMFFTVSGALAVAVTLVVAPFIGSLLHLGAISTSTAAATLIILGVMTAIQFLALVPNAALIGSGRSDRQAQFGIIGFFLTQIGQVVVVIAGGGLIGLAVVSVAGAVFGLVVSASLVRRVTGSSVRHGHFDRALLGELLRFGGRNAIISISGTIAYSLDAVIIGLILPVSQVAPYDIALSTANFNQNLTQQGTKLLLPVYAHSDATGNTDRQARLFSRSVMGGLAISVPIVIALIAFGDPILKLWLGSVPAKTYGIMIALGVVITLQLPGNQCFIYLTGIGRNHLLVRFAILGALLNLAGSIGATFWLGPIGPAIGSLPPVLVIDFVILPLIVCRQLQIPVGTYARTALAPILPAVIVAAVVATALHFLYPVHAGSTLHRGVQAAIGATIVVVTSWITMVAITFRIEPGLGVAVRKSLQRFRS
jgi:O-antigen/teichoic acid export membrane protein